MSVLIFSEPTAPPSPPLAPLLAMVCVFGAWVGAEDCQVVLSSAFQRSAVVCLDGRGREECSCD